MLLGLALAYTLQAFAKTHRIDELSEIVFENRLNELAEEGKLTEDERKQADNLRKKLLDELQTMVIA